MTSRYVSTLRLASPSSVAAGWYSQLRVSPDGATYLLLGRDGGVVGPNDTQHPFAALRVSRLPPVTSVATFDAASGACLGSSRIASRSAFKWRARWFSDGARFVVATEAGDVNGAEIFSKTCVSSGVVWRRDGLVYPIANGRSVYARGGKVRDEFGTIASYDGFELSDGGDFAVAAAGNKWFVIRTSDWRVVRTLSRTPPAVAEGCSDGGETVVATAGFVATIFESDGTIHTDMLPYPFLLSPNGSRALRPTSGPGEFTLWNVRQNRVEYEFRGLTNPVFSRDGLTVLDVARRDDAELGPRHVVDSYDARFDCEIAADALAAALSSPIGVDVPPEMGLGIFRFMSDDAECRAKYAIASSTVRPGRDKAVLTRQNRVA